MTGVVDLPEVSAHAGPGELGWTAVARYHLERVRSGGCGRRALPARPSSGQAARAILPAAELLSPVPARLTIQGWYYPSSNVRKSAPTLMLARSGRSASILSFVVPVRATGSVTYTTRWSGTTFIINLNVGGQRVSVAISGGGSLYRVTPWVNRSGSTS